MEEREQRRVRGRGQDWKRRCTITSSLICSYERRRKRVGPTFLLKKKILHKSMQPNHSNILLFTNLAATKLVLTFESCISSQIDQTGLVLETISQNESLFKLFSEGVYFFKAFCHHYERNTTWQHGMRFAISVDETCCNFFPAWHGSCH